MDLIGAQTDNGAALIDLVTVDMGQFGIDRAHDLAARYLGAAQTGQQFVDTVDGQRLGGGAQRLFGGFLAHVFKRHACQLAPQPDITFAVFFAQGSPDRGFRAARHGDINPCGLRCLAFGGDNLDRLAVFQPRP